jgi:hypothetical protein
MQDLVIAASRPLAAAALLAISATCASADLYDFQFTGGLSSITGTFTVANGNEITAITGTETDQAGSSTITGILPNPNFPGESANANGLFWDNVFSATAPYLTYNGVGFTAQEGLLSLPLALWYNAGSSAYVITGDLTAFGQDVKNLDSGTLTVTAVPEPATWAMFLAGFAALGFAASRRARALAA